MIQRKKTDAPLIHLPAHNLYTDMRCPRSRLTVFGTTMSLFNRLRCARLSHINREWCLNRSKHTRTSSACAPSPLHHSTVPWSVRTCRYLMCCEHENRNRSMSLPSPFTLYRPALCESDAVFVNLTRKRDEICKSNASQSLRPCLNDFTIQDTVQFTHFLQFHQLFSVSRKLGHKRVSVNVWLCQGMGYDDPITLPSMKSCGSFLAPVSSGSSSFRRSESIATSTSS